MIYNYQINNLLKESSFIAARNIIDRCYNTYVQNIMISKIINLKFIKEV